MVLNLIHRLSELSEHHRRLCFFFFFFFLLYQTSSTTTITIFCSRKWTTPSVLFYLLVLLPRKERNSRGDPTSTLLGTLFRAPFPSFPYSLLPSLINASPLELTIQLLFTPRRPVSPNYATTHHVCTTNNDTLTLSYLSCCHKCKI